MCCVNPLDCRYWVDISPYNMTGLLAAKGLLPPAPSILMPAICATSTEIRAGGGPGSACTPTAGYITSDMAWRAVVQAQGGDSVVAGDTFAQGGPLQSVPVGRPSNWLEPYRPLSNCAWVLVAPSGCQLSLQLMFLEAETGHDFLTVSFANGTVLQYTGTVDMPCTVFSGTTEVDGQQIVLRFTADGYLQYSGFVLQYSFGASDLSTVPPLPLEPSTPTPAEGGQPASQPGSMTKPTMPPSTSPPVPPSGIATPAPYGSMSPLAAPAPQPIQQARPALQLLQYTITMEMSYTLLTTSTQVMEGFKLELATAVAAQLEVRALML